MPTHCNLNKSVCANQRNSSATRLSVTGLNWFPAAYIVKSLSCNNTVTVFGWICFKSMSFQLDSESKWFRLLFIYMATNLEIYASKSYIYITEYNHRIITNRLHVDANLSTFNRTLIADWIHLMLLYCHLWIQQLTTSGCRLGPCLWSNQDNEISLLHTIIQSPTAFF